MKKGRKSQQSVALTSAELFSFGMSEDDSFGTFGKGPIVPDVSTIDDQSLKQLPKKGGTTTTTTNNNNSAKKDKGKDEISLERTFDYISVDSILGIEENDFYSSCDELFGTEDDSTKPQSKREMFGIGSGSESGIESTPEDSFQDSSLESDGSSKSSNSSSTSSRKRKGNIGFPSPSPKRNYSSSGAEGPLLEEETVILPTEDFSGKETEKSKSPDAFSSFLKTKEKQTAENFCVGCYFGCLEKEIIYGKAINDLIKLIYDNYGSLDNNVLAKSAHTIYKYRIYNECKKYGYDCPMWRTKSIKEHIEKHCKDPRLFIGETMKHLTKDILALNKIMYKVYAKEDGTQELQVDLPTLKARNDLLKAQFIVYRSNPKMMNFYNEKRQIDLERFGSLINTPTYIKMQYSLRK